MLKIDHNQIGTIKYTVDSAPKDVIMRRTGAEEDSFIICPSNLNEAKECIAIYANGAVAIIPTSIVTRPLVVAIGVTLTNPI